MIEPLEARIAPALVVALNQLSATWTDVDGDLVTLKVSKPILDLGDFTYGAAGLGEEVQALIVGDDAVNGLDITITAKPQDVTADGRKDGDGLVNIGWINSVNSNLCKVSITGDLGAVDAGDATGIALKSLTLVSLGERGSDTGAPDLRSQLDGKVGPVVIKGNVRGSIEASTELASVTIGGSLIGGAVMHGGKLAAGVKIGAVKIAGDMVGGSADYTGAIDTGASLASLTVGGSVRGGGGYLSGGVDANNIGPVKIGGDLRGGAGEYSAKIDGGATLASLTVGGSVIGGDGDSSASAEAGVIGAVKIGLDLRGGSNDRTGFIDGGTSIASMAIGGSVIGGGGLYSGSVDASKITSVKIRGDLIGSGGTSSGSLVSLVGGMPSVTIGGSVIGGNGSQSGFITGSTLGTISIGGDLIGGDSASSSGVITAVFGIGSVKILGSVIGGSTSQSGFIESAGTIKTVVIGRDVIGGNSTGVNRSDMGSIQAGQLPSVTLGGSLIAGQKLGAGTLSRSGSINATDDIGTLTIKGNIVGNSTNAALITARGALTPTGANDVAIKNLTVGGRVEWASILAGYTELPRGKNADAQIGSVSVGGDWIASNLVAGVDPTNGYFGDPTDVPLIAGTDYGSGPTTDDTGRISKIGSVTIRGGIYGTNGIPGVEHFGFVAEHIVSFKVNGVAVPLTSGSKNDTFALNAALPIGSGFSTGVTDNFEVHIAEV